MDTLRQAGTIFHYAGASYAKAGGRNRRRGASKLYVVGGHLVTLVTRLLRWTMVDGDETNVKWQGQSSAIPVVPWE